MEEKGFKPIGNTSGKYKPGQTGIDGIYSDPNPKPKPYYVITEAKYNRSRLGRTKDGCRQMSNDWVTDKRLEDAGLSKAERDMILDSLEMGDGGVEKYLIRTKPDGTMTTRTLDKNGYLSGIPNGF